MTARLEPLEVLRIEVQLGGKLRRVGRLARRNRRIYFEYDAEFLATGLSLSPLKLPLKAGLAEADPEPFEGLHGVFNDSLPDGWGRLLLDRRLSEKGLAPTALTPLDRLAYVGSRGLGALCYFPEIEANRPSDAIDLDALASGAQSVLDGDAENVLGQLLELGGSSGGARPKVLVGCSEDHRKLVAGVGELPSAFAHWMVKFRSASDAIDIGAVEYAYSQMVRLAGITMEPTHLFTAAKGPGYFGTRRFDRRGDVRRHVHTISGLVHADHRIPSMGYDTLLKVTRHVTKNQLEVDEMFRRMAFNVLAHNRDDHPKNHSLILDDAGEWRCSPAYDITFSSGPRGEHALLVAREGKSPGLSHLAEVARSAGVSEAKQRSCIDDVKAALARWPALAEEAGVARASIKTIDLALNGPRAVKKAPAASAAKRAPPRRAAKPAPKSRTKPRTKAGARR